MTATGSASTLADSNDDSGAQRQAKGAAPETLRESSEAKKAATTVITIGHH